MEILSNQWTIIFESAINGLLKALRSEEERERAKGSKGGRGGSGLRKEEVVGDISKVSMGGEEKVIPVVGSGVGVALGNNIGNRVEGEKKFLPLQEDIDRASRGFLEKIKNGCCVSFIQQSFEDAGFLDLKLISLGGDNVLLYPQGDGVVMEVISEAAAFFDNFLSEVIPWSKDVV